MARLKLYKTTYTLLNARITEKNTLIYYFAEKTALIRSIYTVFQKKKKILSTYTSIHLYTGTYIRSATLQ